MKRYVTFLVLFIMTSTAFGQGSSEAQKLLDEVSAKLNSYENMYVEFKYVLDNKKENVHQETRGNATMKGDLYNVNFLGSNQLYDGKKIYTIIPEDEEVNIADVDTEEDDTLTPSKFFSFYKNGFTYDWAELKNINGRKIQYVKLNPIDSNSPIAKVLLGIDVNTKHIYNLIETGKNTTVTTLTVTKFKHDQELSNSLFSFDEAKFKAKGYLINKL
ncbi:MAG: outer membrane lipoprotein carrier protein LolA [Flavobacteriaceae bacterium]|nr:outer membrane lipoprotein carrier protein LolA [Flavobacteriaceae bacterium]